MLRTRRARVVALVVVAILIAGLVSYFRSGASQEAPPFEEVPAFDQCRNIPDVQSDVPAGREDYYGECLTPQEVEQRSAEAAEAKEQRRILEEQRHQAVIDRLRPLIEAETSLDGRLSVIVTDYCRSASRVDTAGTMSAPHEELYGQYWEATPEGRWDANIYRAASKSCGDRVPMQYTPKEPLSADDFCPGTTRLRHPTWGCGAAG